MPNICLLKGLRCPKCDSYGPLIISVPIMVLIFDDGQHLDLRPCDMKWKDDSFCRCDRCSYAATVKDFKDSTEKGKRNA